MKKILAGLFLISVVTLPMKAMDDDVFPRVTPEDLEVVEGSQHNDALVPENVQQGQNVLTERDSRFVEEIYRNSRNGSFQLTSFAAPNSRTTLESSTKENDGEASATTGSNVPLEQIAKQGFMKDLSSSVREKVAAVAGAAGASPYKSGGILALIAAYVANECDLIRKKRMGTAEQAALVMGLRAAWRGIAYPLSSKAVRKDCWDYVVKEFYNGNKLTVVETFIEIFGPALFGLGVGTYCGGVALSNKFKAVRKDIKDMSSGMSIDPDDEQKIEIELQ